MRSLRAQLAKLPAPSTRAGPEQAVASQPNSQLALHVDMDYIHPGLRDRRSDPVALPPGHADEAMTPQQPSLQTLSPEAVRPPSAHQAMAMDTGHHLTA